MTQQSQLDIGTIARVGYRDEACSGRFGRGKRRIYSRDQRKVDRDHFIRCPHDRYKFRLLPEAALRKPQALFSESQIYTRMMHHLGRGRIFVE